MHDHMYMIDLPSGGMVIATGDSVYMTPDRLVVRLGDAVTASLSRAEYLSIGPWTARPEPPRHVAPDPTDPADVAMLAGGAA